MVDSRRYSIILDREDKKVALLLESYYSYKELQEDILKELSKVEPINAIITDKETNNKKCLTIGGGRYGI